MNFVFCSPLACLMVFILVIHHSVTKVDCDGDDGDESCKSIQKPSDGKFDVLCVGMLRTRMLMITTDWMVYDMPMVSLSSTINKLYLNGTKPIPVAEKWPNLVNSERYKLAHQIMYNCFTVVDKVGDYLIGTTKLSTKRDGFRYDLGPQTVGRGFYYKGNDTQVLISSNELNSFYAINKGFDGEEKDIRIMRYVFQSDTAVNSTYINPEKNDSAFYRMCKVGNSQIEVVKSESSKCDPLGWPVLKGFIANHIFYLFGGNYIFTFPAAVYDDDNEPVQFQKILMNDFIQCSGNITADARMGATTSGIFWGVIIAVILIIAIAVLICILCMMREARKKKEKKEKKEIKQDGSSKNSRAAQSDRSTGVNGFGQLSNKQKNPSKKRASSKRSRKNSKASARSGPGLGKYGKLTAKCPDKSGHSASHSTRSSSKRKGSKSRSRNGQSGSARSGNIGKPKKISHKANSAKHSAGRNDLTARTGIN